MKEIKLTKNYSALVDDDDFVRLSFYKWRALVTHYKNNVKVYACTSKGEYMHRILTNCPKGMKVDHDDGNTLNNQKYNLRVCTHTENLRNQVSSIKKYKGTEYKPKDKRFNAYIRVNKKSISLGYYKTEETAAYAYNVAAIYYFKEFANLNKLDLSLVDFKDYNRYMLKKEAKLLTSYFSHEKNFYSQY